MSRPKKNRRRGARWFGELAPNRGIPLMVAWGVCAAMVRHDIPNEGLADTGTTVSYLVTLALLSGGFAASLLFVRLRSEASARYPQAPIDRLALAAALGVVLAIWASGRATGLIPVVKAALVIGVAGGPSLSVLYLQRRSWPNERRRCAMLIGVLAALWGLLGLWLVAHWRAAPQYAAIDSSLKLLSYDLLVGGVAVGVFALSTLQALHAAPVERCKLRRIEQLLQEEQRILARRRAAAGLATGAAGERPPSIVGLALSGGGIRSATVALGFLSALAELKGAKERPLLDAVDYLSTVSGGGWIGGALTARFAARGLGAKGPDGSESPTFDPRKRAGWRALADHLRRRGDYLVPGGIGVTTGTLKPVLSLVWGGIVNISAFVLLAGGVCALLFNLAHPGRDDTSVVISSLSTVAQVGWWQLLFINPCSMPLLHEHLFAANLVPLILLGLVVAFGCVLFAIFIGFLFSEHLSHGRPLGWASRLAVAIVIVGVCTLALKGSVYFTMIVIASLTIGVALLLGRRMSLRQFAGALAGLVATERLASINDSVMAFMQNVTAGWASLLERALVWPGQLTMNLGAAADTVDAFDNQRLAAGAFCLLFFGFSFVVNRNRTSLHAFWRRQIRDAYLAGLVGEPADKPIHELSDDLWPATAKLDPWPSRAPLHIMTAAVNTPGSQDATLAKRGTARFELSPLFIGGSATGWAPARYYAQHRVSLATAVAVSAAAVNSQGGTAIPRWARMLLAALNLGLGYWLPNPRVMIRGDVRGRVWPHFWTGHLAREMLGYNDESSSMLFVSDGGHHDNLGLSALVERGCDLVIAVDAAADPRYELVDLANVTRMLRIDGDWELKDFDPESLRAETGDRFADRIRDCAVVTGSFCRMRAGVEQRVHFVYVKACMVRGLPIDADTYARTHPQFPQQTTADQWFDEAQFEAYFTLGAALARQTRAALDTEQLCAILPGQEL